MSGTQATPSTYAGFAGFDVSKDSVCLHHRTTGRTGTIPNRPAELRRAARSLPPGTLCVCEPTGGHERLLLEVLRAEGLPCHRADARKVKAYIRSLGIHGKTDAIDARALARYGERRHADLAQWAEPDGRRDELRALDARRRDLVRMRTAEKNRAKAPGAKGRIAGSCKRMPALIEDELREIGGAMDALIAASGGLSRRREVLTSLKGVGAATANTLIASMPELGAITGKQAASLAGVAPHPRQSGKRNACRRMTGGRPEIKQALFMAALVAARHNPELRQKYQRFISDGGKKPIVANSIIMRNIIVILNAKVRDMILEKQMS